MNTASVQGYRQNEESVHDQIVWQVAGALTCKGYSVMANHPRWAGYRPYKINNHQPDIIASKDASKLFLEIETCETMATELPKQKLQSLAEAGRVMVIVPSYCIHGKKVHSPPLDLKEQLSLWGLPQIGVGTCDPQSGTVSGI